MTTLTYDANLSVLRLMVRSAYGLQKLRMQAGLRLVSNFRAKLHPPSAPASAEIEIDDDADTDAALETDKVKDKELSAEALNILEVLRLSYTRLTDGVARNRTLPTEKGFTGDAVISDFAELVLVSHYIALETQERAQFSQMTALLERFPIYNTFLSPTRGIGPAMAAVLIASFDIKRAVRPSQFWAYAGLDVAPDGRGRSRRREHLVEREYTKADGTKATRMGTTYDPWLHSRLLHSLATSFMKSKSPWRQVYDNYKHRLVTDPSRIKMTSVQKSKLFREGQDVGHIWTPGRIHRASMRYMVKMFLLDFWREWRIIEGLPVVPSYAEAKLGLVHKGNHLPQSSLGLG